MFGLALVVLITPAPLDDPRGDFPDVSLADLRDFELRGLGAHQAKVGWRLACRHMDFYGPEIAAFYTGTAYQAWFDEAYWCRCCWDALDNAFGGHSSHAKPFLLSELDRLRMLLGDERYHRRDMPTPSPGWMFKPTDLWVKTTRP